MIRSYGTFTAGLLATGVMGFAAPWWGLGTVDSVRAEEPSKKIEIIAKDGQVTVSGYTLTDEPTVVVFRNEDTMVHGFNSSVFKDLNAKVEGDGYLAKGKGPNVYRVDPGKTMMVRFNTKPSTNMDEGSKTYAFWCDLHPNMKGEMFVLSQKGIGGG